MVEHELDFDFLHSASHRNLIAHLSGPFVGGAKDTLLAVDAQGRVDVDRATRHPLVVIAPRADVGPAGLEIAAQLVVEPGTPAPAPVLVRFEPYTEAGAFLPIYHRQPQPSAAEMSRPFAVLLARVGGGAVDEPLHELVEARLVEGLLGRLLYVLGAEKQRIRRQAREIMAVRSLPGAFGNSLDRLGMELGVPRFTDRVSWNTQLGQADSITAREPDEAYRRRLSLYRPMLMPTRRRLAELINGPEHGPANSGLLADLGVRERFTIHESNTEFAVSMRLIGPRRMEFIQYVRDIYLLDPSSSIPEHRLHTMTASERQRQEQMMARLRTHFTLPAGLSLAPGLAWALDWVGRCRAALQITRPWRVLRAQDDAGGSRYELGLGVDLEVLPADEIALLVQNKLQRQYAAGTPIDVGQLLDSLEAAPPEEDPAGRWLLAACGLRTVHALPENRYYVSHVPAHGMVMSDGDQPGELELRFHAPEDVGPDALLFFGLADAERDAAVEGWPVWTRLGQSDAAAARGTAVVPPAAALAAFAAAGLRTPNTVRDLTRAVTDLALVPGELMVTLAMEPGLASGLLASEPGAIAVLQRMIASFKRHELVAVLPLVTATSGVLLIVGAAALPGSAALLNTRRQSFRWYVLPVAGAPPELQQVVGSRNQVSLAADTGVAAIMAVAVARQNRADPRGRVMPYEVSMELPPGATLNLEQYEFLMNLLDHVAPIGVTIDTRRVREQHVDPGQQGAPVPFIGPLAHSFRAFRQRRQVGKRNLNNEP